MKVNIDKTINVSDEQRQAIARFLDGAEAKKRDATRDEMKEFIWAHGEAWESILEEETYTASSQPATPSAAQGADEDLIGSESPAEDSEEDLIGGSDDADLIGDTGDDEDLI